MRLHALIAAAALCAPLAAQHHPDTDGPVRIRGMEVFSVDTHEGPQLKLKGREEGDNSFRHLTPALARADTSIATVDRQALYDRKMAMYSEGKTFTNFPGGDESLPPPTPAVMSSRKDPEEPSSWKGFVVVGLVIISGVFGYRAFCRD